MGTNVAPLLANLYLYYKVDLEIKNKMAYFKRFIDDVFFLYKGSRENLLLLIDSFAKLAAPLKITYTIDTNSVAFLDLNIQLSNEGSIYFKTYQKSMNLYEYIPSFSSHSYGVFKGFIFGELKRYIRTNSRYQDFDFIRTLFWKRLTDRGYSSGFLRPLFLDSKVSWLKKHAIEDDLTSSKPLFALPVRFVDSNRLKALKKVLHEFNDLIPWSDVLLTYKKSPSVLSLLTRSNLTSNQINWIKMKDQDLVKDWPRLIRVQAERN
jgi:hypothetical protein